MSSATTWCARPTRCAPASASPANTPDLLFLDEPTTGLDPRSRNQVWEIVRAAEVLWSLGWAALLIAVFGPITMRLYNRK
jgi:ABC-type sulfate/molybdate transport systems ATPase subunit